MFGKSKTKIPENVNWAERAVPSEVVPAIPDEFSALGLAENARERKRVRKENRAWMKQQLVRNGGRVVGYHGTSSRAAGLIQKHGFADTLNEEGRSGVSAWHVVAAGRAAAFAKDRAEKHGDSEGEGVVIEVAMTNPRVDELGRLEWRGDAGKVKILRSWPAAEFVKDPEAAIRASAGALALSEEVA